MTMFCRYVDRSMKFAKIQRIPSVTGIAAAASMNGSRNASEPKTKIRIASAIGIAMKSSPTKRSLFITGSRSCSTADCPVT